MLSALDAMWMIHRFAEKASSTDSLALSSADEAALVAESEFAYKAKAATLVPPVLFKRLWSCFTIHRCLCQRIQRTLIRTSQVAHTCC